MTEYFSSMLFHSLYFVSFVIDKMNYVLGFRTPILITHLSRLVYSYISLWLTDWQQVHIVFLYLRLL